MPTGQNAFPSSWQCPPTFLGKERSKAPCFFLLSHKRSSVWCDSNEAKGPQGLSSDTKGQLRATKTAEKEVSCLGCITGPHFADHTWPASLFSSCAQLARSCRHLCFSPLSQGPGLAQDRRCVGDRFGLRKCELELPSAGHGWKLPFP